MLLVAITCLVYVLTSAWITKRIHDKARTTASIDRLKFMYMFDVVALAVTLLCMVGGLVVASEGAAFCLALCVSIGMHIYGARALSKRLALV